MKILPGLRQVASHYDAILCDVWGVLHNGRKAFAAASEALVAYRAQGGRVVLVTNAPVPNAQVVRYFEPLGVSHDSFDACVSSGDATRALLETYTGKTVWRMGADEGWEHDKFLYEGLDIEFTDQPDKADIGLLIGLRNQADDHPDDYANELSEVAKTGLTLICANPDIQVRIGDKLHWCAGALAQIYESSGGQVVYPGKPHAAIYDLARALLKDMGCTPAPNRILAIGDSPITDIRGANAQGFDALYVGTGLASHDSGDFAGGVARLMAEEDVVATYAQPELAW